MFSAAHNQYLSVNTRAVIQTVTNQRQNSRWPWKEEALQVESATATDAPAHGGHKEWLLGDAPSLHADHNPARSNFSHLLPAPSQQTKFHAPDLNGKDISWSEHRKK